MLVCNGDGELLIHPVNGDVIWGEAGSPILSYCHQNSYKFLISLAQDLDIDTDEFELEFPECNDDCPRLDHCLSCLDEDEELDNIYCSAIDEKLASELIMTALSKLSDSDRNEVLGYNMEVDPY